MLNKRMSQENYSIAQIDVLSNNFSQNMTREIESCLSKARTVKNKNKTLKNDKGELCQEVQREKNTKSK